VQGPMVVEASRAANGTLHAHVGALPPVPCGVCLVDDVTHTTWWGFWR
jgi:hypothetical protein